MLGGGEFPECDCLGGKPARQLARIEGGRGQGLEPQVSTPRRGDPLVGGSFLARPSSLGHARYAEQTARTRAGHLVGQDSASKGCLRALGLHRDRRKCKPSILGFGILTKT